VAVNAKLVLAAGQMVLAAGSVTSKPGAAMMETVPETEPVWGQPVGGGNGL
jgi:hypothetical protein